MDAVQAIFTRGAKCCQWVQNNPSWKQSAYHRKRCPPRGESVFATRRSFSCHKEKCFSPRGEVFLARRRSVHTTTSDLRWAGESSDGHVSEQKNTPLYWTNAQQYMMCLDLDCNVQKPIPFLSSVCGIDKYLFCKAHYSILFSVEIFRRQKPVCCPLQVN